MIYAIFIALHLSMHGLICDMSYVICVGLFRSMHGFHTIDTCLGYTLFIIFMHYLFDIHVSMIKYINSSLCHRTLKSRVTSPVETKESRVKNYYNHLSV